MSVLKQAELTPEIEGKYYSPKMQWWCAHADLVDADGVETALYFWPALGALDEAWICSLHIGKDVIDLTDLHLPVGTFETVRHGVDVTYGEQYIRGTYPDYEIAVGGVHNGENVSLKITMDADHARIRGSAQSPGHHLALRAALRRSGHPRAGWPIAAGSRRRLPRTPAGPVLEPGNRPGTVGEHPRPGSRAFQHSPVLQGVAQRRVGANCRP